MTFDLILKGGWVIDGTGGPAFRADVALIDTMIAEVGRLEGAEAARVVDVTGQYVVPGFIDAHVHGDLMLLADPIHLPALRQGVTTYLIGQDGSSFAPASPATLDYMRRYTAGFNGNPAGLSYDWRTVGEYLARFDRRVAINVAYLIPNGNVRMEVMGLDPRPASDDELRAMQKLVRAGHGRRGDRALDGAGLYPQPLRRRPRNRRALRTDRRGERRVRNAHAGLRPARGRRACARSTISPERPASRPTSRTYNGRPISCFP